MSEDWNACNDEANLASLQTLNRERVPLQLSNYSETYTRPAKTDLLLRWLTVVLTWPCANKEQTVVGASRGSPPLWLALCFV